MAWQQLLLDCTADAADSVADLLSELGADAVTLEDAADQPLYEPPPGATPLWQHTRVIALFADSTDVKQVLAQLAIGLAPATLPDWRVQWLQDKAWEREWMRYFQPLRIGERVWICPSWCAPPDPQAVNILLDPGLAFGTGSHPTTALCLLWLDQHAVAKDLVIDYGCGSGILALAAAKLGAQRVYAVDNDPQALSATQTNAERNAVAAQISAFLPHELPPARTPLLLANILAGPLIELAPRFAALVQAGGSIVLSGLLKEQTEAVSHAYQPWFDLAAPIQREDWILLSGVRRD